MTFPTGRHHWQDVILAMLSATLQPIQGQALPPHAMGDTALACFGQIPTIDRQRAWWQWATKSDDVDNDDDSSNKVITSSTHCPISRRVTFNKTNEWIVPSKREKISTDLYQQIYQLVCSFGKMASFMGTTTNKSVGPIWSCRKKYHFSDTK